MAATLAALSSAPFTAAIIASSYRASPRSRNNVTYIKGMNSFEGLKAHDNVVSLGLPICSEQCFGNIVCSLKFPTQGKRSGGGGGGALSSTCNAAGEIFRIAAIMNGLVLIGVAVGFVLLRIEASLEEEP